MALRPGSRRANVEQSLTDYLHAQLVTALGVAVRFPRMALWNTLPVRWVQVDYLPMSQRRDTSRVRVGIGHEREMAVNCNCLEQLVYRTNNSGLAGWYSLPMLVDQVLDVFGPGANIPLRDFVAVGDPVVSCFHVRSTRQTPVAVPEGLPLEQQNVSVTLAFEEEYV